MAEAETQSTNRSIIQTPAGGWVLGFMSITMEQGYLGAYLVTNSWGRPLEFRLTTAVNPSKVQQILYGATLETHVVAELIGKALIEKSALPAHVILVDHQAALELQAGPDVMVAFVSRREGDAIGLHRVAQLPDGNASVYLRHPDPVLEERIANLFHALPTKVDLLDPFQRAQEAMTEARKLGTGTRAA